MHIKINQHHSFEECCFLNIITKSCNKWDARVKNHCHQKMHWFIRVILYLSNIKSINWHWIASFPDLSLILVKFNSSLKTLVTKHKIIVGFRSKTWKIDPSQRHLNLLRHWEITYEFGHLAYAMRKSSCINVKENSTSQVT